MAQKRKGTATRISKKKSPTVRQSKRRGGEVAIVACTCAVKLEAADPIESVSGGGADASFFRPAYSTEPACTGHQDCAMIVEYKWVLSNAAPAQTGGPVPVIDGDPNVRTVRVKNKGSFKLHVEVRVKCSRPGAGAIRVTRCSDSGEAEFEIR